MDWHCIADMVGKWDLTSTLGRSVGRFKGPEVNRVQMQGWVTKSQTQPGRWQKVRPARPETKSSSKQKWRRTRGRRIFAPALPLQLEVPVTCWNCTWIWPHCELGLAYYRCASRDKLINSENQTWGLQKSNDCEVVQCRSSMYCSGWFFH